MPALGQLDRITDADGKHSDLPKTARARTDGRVYTWLRVRRQTGRGEGSSGLGFDELINVPIKQ